MTIQVTGTLTDPVGVPLAAATIRIKSLETSNVVASASATITTGAGGTYDFNLLEGKFQIEVLQTNKYNKIAYVEVTNLTTTPITLEALIDTYAFCEVTAPTCPV